MREDTTSDHGYGNAVQWDWEVNPSDPSGGLFPTETIRPVDPSDPSDGLFPTETIRPADTFLPLEQGAIVHNDIHYDLMI
jgi:hypothetical protein